MKVEYDRCVDTTTTNDLENGLADRNELWMPQGTRTVVRTVGRPNANLTPIRHRPIAVLEVVLLK